MRVLITGAGGAIGGAIVRAFAKEGCRLLLCGRSASALEQMKRELSVSGIGVEIFAADVSEIEDSKKLRVFASEHFGHLDILVLAAGIYGEIGAIEDCDESRWLDAVKTNLFGAFLCIKYALPLMERGGRIITLAGGGEGPLPFLSSYACSKGAVIRLTESLSKELEDRGIGINAISPGWVNSGLTEAIIQAGPAKAGQERYDKAVKERSGEVPTVSPDRAAALAVFLAASESSGLTGKNISAAWDNWKEIPEHLKIIMESDIYSWRRIKPRDRGYEWR